jgi:hypothetical protein
MVAVAVLGEDQLAHRGAGDSEQRPHDVGVPGTERLRITGTPANPRVEHHPAVDLE